MIKKLLLYCTKGKPYLVYGSKFDGHNFIDTYCLTRDYSKQQVDEIWGSLNGKVVAECDFEVEKISSEFYADYNYSIYDYVEFKTETLDDEELEKRSCIDYYKMCEYLGFYEGDKEKVGYAIHIKNLNIFDEPKELSDYYAIHNIGGMLLTDKLTKAPQNMQRVSIQEWEYGTYNANDIAILISMHPEGLCKIFNSEKTIILSKKVLKGMLYE